LKKNQKTFTPLRAYVTPARVTLKNQSFFASFCSQKEVLSSPFICKPPVRTVLLGNGMIVLLRS
jgi:hypothetical protein